MFMLTAIIMLNPPHLTLLIYNCHQTNPHKPKKVPHTFATCSSQLPRTLIPKCVGSDHRNNITWQKLLKIKKFGASRTCHIIQKDKNSLLLWLTNL